MGYFGAPRLHAPPLRRVALLVALGLCWPSVTVGQAFGRAHVGVHAGSLSHSLLGVVNGTFWAVGPNGLAVDADVEAEPSTLLGARLALELAPSLDVRARIARAGTHMRVNALTEPIGGTGTQTFTVDGLGDVAVWLIDVDLRWKPWTRGSPIVPYVLAGVGAVHWDVSGLEDLGTLELPLGSPVSLSDANTFLPGAVFGVGLETGSFGPLALELELSDHLSGDPLHDGDFHIGSEFAGHGRAKDLVHNLSLTAGIRVALGR